MSLDKSQIPLTGELRCDRWDRVWIYSTDKTWVPIGNVRGDQMTIYEMNVAVITKFSEEDDPSPQDETKRDFILCKGVVADYQTTHDLLEKIDNKLDQLLEK